MKKLKNLIFVQLVLIVVLVLVIVRSASKNRFKQDAENAIEAVVSNNFTVSESELKSKGKEYLIVNLNESEKTQYDNSLQISINKLLEESTLQKLKEAENKILLVSDDNSVAEKAWVILNQLDIKNVFVLSTEDNPEVLKYEFHPDTAARLESVIE